MTTNALFDRWVWRMAWRDSRRSRGRLLVFSTALTLGVAALVAIGSVGWNLQRAIHDQARTLVGADLIVEARAPLDADAERFVASLGGTDLARETRLASMTRFPKTGASRLTQVRALAGDYPFYGAIETRPPEAARDFYAGKGALLEESLLLQYGAKIGDRIDIGGQTFPILGAVTKLPGEANAFASIAPRVLIPRDRLPAALTARGSLVRYFTYLKLPAGVPATRVVSAHKDEFRTRLLETDTVAHRERQLGRVFADVNRFLNLVSFVALLLGGIGVASAIQAHLKTKLRTVAVLRCLGASAQQTLVIYLLQGLALGLVGAVSGAVLGLGLQAIAPVFLRGVLPVDLHFGISWAAVGEGIGVGFLTCALFVLLPLLPVRRTPPLLALRSAFESNDAVVDAARRRDPWRWFAYGLLGLALLTFPWLQSQDRRLGLGFSGGLFVAFGLLALVAWALMRAARRWFPQSWPFEWRQGLANLYRPNNRTLVLVFTLGLSTFLLLGMYLTKDILLRQFDKKGDNATQPNLVFFDVQTDQKDAVADVVRTHQLPVMAVVPMVTMRLVSARGKTVDALADERPGKGQEHIDGWRLHHEYRSTYRDRLIDSETLVRGSLTAHAAEGSGVDLARPVPVSVEEDMAKNLRVNLGDPLVFDVQGIPFATTVGSIRKVDWSRFEPNFFVVFPTGVLEAAPTFNVLVTRAPNATVSGQTQADVVRRFPTVSAIDLSLIVATIKGIIDKATAAVRLLSVFTVGTGLLVLTAAILTGRYERVKEGVLLRTLGASRRQILRILTVEYFCLGSLAAFTGILLAAAGNWALAVFVFKLPWAPSPVAMVACWFIVAGLTVAIGLLASRGVCDHPPLEILRAEE